MRSRDPIPRHPSTPTVHGKLWIEIAGVAALTDAGADLLEQIDVTGSLSEAARRLKFSYRRAWMLADAMNRRWPAPLLQLSVGGRGGGGARLTEMGRAVVLAYRDLQIQLEHVLEAASAALNAALPR